MALCLRETRSLVASREKYRTKLRYRPPYTPPFRRNYATKRAVSPCDSPPILTPQPPISPISSPYSDSSNMGDCVSTTRIQAAVSPVKRNLLSTAFNDCSDSGYDSHGSPASGRSEDSTPACVPSDHAPNACHWLNCATNFLTQDLLMDHILCAHVRSQLNDNKQKVSKDDESTAGDPQYFSCLWTGCKVYKQPSKLLSWLEAHVILQHCGAKPFACVFAHCTERFSTKGALEKHLNAHFLAEERERKLTLPVLPVQQGKKQANETPTTNEAALPTAAAMSPAKTTRRRRRKISKDRRLLQPDAIDQFTLEQMLDVIGRNSGQSYFHSAIPTQFFSPVKLGEVKCRVLGKMVSDESNETTVLCRWTPAGLIADSRLPVKAVRDSICLPWTLANRKSLT